MGSDRVTCAETHRCPCGMNYESPDGSIGPGWTTSTRYEDKTTYLCPRCSTITVGLDAVAQPPPNYEGAWRALRAEVRDVADKAAKPEAKSVGVAFLDLMAEIGKAHGCES